MHRATIQELLGYATIEMTMRYAHLSPDVSRHAVKLLDGLGSSAAPRRTLGDRWATRAVCYLLLRILRGGAESRTCPANDQKTKRRSDLHGHCGDLTFS